MHVVKPLNFEKNTSPKLDKKEPLQVRIPVGIKRAFKSHAALLGLEPNELFVKIWEQYEDTQLKSTKEIIK